jgi:putative transposase
LFRALKSPLKLNNKEKSYLRECAGLSRFAWNWGLSLCNDLYKSGVRFPGCNKLKEFWNSEKYIKFPWVTQYSKCIPDGVFERLDLAFRKFFSGYKQGKKIGYPKFRKKKDLRQSFKFHGSIHITDTRIKLPKINRELRFVRKSYIKPNKDEKIGSAVVSFDGLKWNVSVNLLSEDKEIKYKKVEKSTTLGIDLGLKKLAVLSDGQVINRPKFYHKAEDKLKTAQRRLSRKVKGSSNYNKQKLVLTKLYRKVSDQRKDFTHKFTTNTLKQDFSKIVLEDLSLPGMVQKWGKSVSDASLGEIKRQFIYKGPKFRTTVELANRFFPSSKKCSHCGVVKAKLLLSERTFCCDFCGFSLDRDMNAAINLRDYIPTVSGKFTPVERRSSTPEDSSEARSLVEAGTEQVDLHNLCESI